MSERPPRSVLESFCADEALLRPLPGGQGVTWRAGPLVLKPTVPGREAEWVGSLLSDVREDGFRLSRPIRAAHGGWNVAGWSAWSWVAGSHDFARRWSDVLAAGAAFHSVLRGVERPGFLDDRDDIWSQGDRAAWQEEPPAVVHVELARVLDALLLFRSPTEMTAQVIHGDLSGNVLFAGPGGRPEVAAPAIIDFVPYWRPAAFAAAIVVADAIAWHGAGRDLAGLLASEQDSRSMLARAAIYRLITSDAAATGQGDAATAYLQDNAEALERIVRVLTAM